MYSQKNGILYINGEPKIALGTSYYPSFHKKKYPVPPEGDRVGEMKKDIKAMRDFGLHQVRIAALCNFSLNENDEIVFEGDFIDSMIKEIAKYDMTSSVRLQGYVTNVRGNKDYLMINHKGEPMQGDWAAFITASLFHEGINRDTDEVTAILSRHYKEMPGVISIQTYNEPHYPFNGVFDYHPDTVAAYKKWLSENGLEVKEPPREKPKAGEDKSDWINWRIFSMRAMSNFLNSAADIAKRESGLEGYTCATSAPAAFSMMEGGISYFDLAEGMDLLGITKYANTEGTDYYAVSYVNDLAESAAATFGKHAWTIEADARVKMTGRKSRQNVYSTLGAGHKGINFYEWRGDYPDEGTPRPDNCGIIHNYGRKSRHYDDTKAMVDFVNKYSTLFAKTEKHRDGFGLLYSEHAFAYSNADSTCSENIAQRDILTAYKNARKLGFCVDMTRAEDLKANPLNIKVLVVPYEREMLSADEMKAIEEFAKADGHRVYMKRTNAAFSLYAPDGFWELLREVKDVATDRFESNYEIEDIMDETGITPLVKCSSTRVHAATLDGEGYKLVTVVNGSAAELAAKNVVFEFSDVPKSARLLTPEREEDIEISDGKITVPEIDDGCVIHLIY